jgi:alanine racemase
MNATNWLEVDLSALAGNLARFGAAMGPAGRICAVVKADAYGLGAVPVARRLVDEGVDLLAVYSPDEARELTSGGIAGPILILMPVRDLGRTDVLYRAAVAGRLQLTVHGEEQLQRVQAIGRQFGTPIGVHVELDSGMSRGGMTPDEAERIIRRVAAMRYVNLVGLFTHPACAATDIAMTHRQMHAMDRLVERCGEAMPSDLIVHFANTHAALRDRKYHRDMLRIGLGLYGYGQADMAGSINGGVADLRPVARWMSRIAHVHAVPSGTPVGYGATFTTWRDSRLGIVPVGYSHGYPRALSNKALVRVGEDLHPAEVRGAISMDQHVIDLTDLPEAAVGTPVEVYANDPSAPNALPALAEAARSSSYELLTRLNPRLTRQYVHGKAPGSPHGAATGSGQ